MASSAIHVYTLIANVKEVNRLSQIHSQLTAPGPGRKRYVQILNKSSIVLFAACWEAFVEDLATEALEFLIRNAKSPMVVPDYVRERVGKAHLGIKAWDLAGSGWKKALRGNLKGVLARTTEKLNTPRAEHVDDLFHQVVGLPAISSSWYWPGRSVAQSKEALGDLITLRGDIAHRLTTARSVHLKNVNDSRLLIMRLAVKSHNRVRAFLEKNVGKFPWTPVGFGKTS